MVRFEIDFEQSINLGIAQYLQNLLDVANIVIRTVLRSFFVLLGAALAELGDASAVIAHPKSPKHYLQKETSLLFQIEYIVMQKL